MTNRLDMLTNDGPDLPSTLLTFWNPAEKLAQIIQDRLTTNPSLGTVGYCEGACSPKFGLRDALPEQRSPVRLLLTSFVARRGKTLEWNGTKEYS